MAATRIQTAKGNGGGYVNSTALAFGSNVTAGSLIVVAISISLDTHNVISVTDTQGRTYTKILEGDANSTESEMWYCANASAGSTTITVTITAATYADMVIIAREYGGLTSTPLDKSAATTEGSYVETHNLSATAATTQANELVVAMYSGDDSAAVYTLGAGYSNLSSQAGDDLYMSIALEDKNVTSTGAQSASFGSTGYYMQGWGMIATFKESGGTPVSPRATMMMMGV